MMKVTIIEKINGTDETIYIGRQGMGSGCIYFFGLNAFDDKLDVGQKIDIDEWFLEVPEKELKKFANVLSGGLYPDELPMHKCRSFFLHRTPLTQGVLQKLLFGQSLPYFQELYFLERPYRFYWHENLFRCTL